MVIQLPKEIKDVEEFIRLSEKARLCFIKKKGGEVKLKLRTPSYLYTLKTNLEQFNEVLKKIKCETKEI